MPRFKNTRLGQFHRELRRFVAARRAVASIEFAISGLALFLFLLAVINIGYLGLVLSALQHGAQSAAREAAVQTSSSIQAGGTCSGARAVRGYFNQAASPPLPVATDDIAGATQVSTVWTNNSANNSFAGTYVTVTAAYRWTPIGLPVGVVVPLSISASDVVIGTPTGGATCS